MGQWHRIRAGAGPQQRLEALGFFADGESQGTAAHARFKNGALVVQVGDAVFALRPGEAQSVALEPSA